ncbi:MAG: RagB/SusD family nutrient uptake outer membrane protein, partial [Candidatus Symbiothrix sp.]|nr:RagB/SusD family nutrient uptake outer membrane protein [Candidatus Symbiothrix sp.]
MKNRILSRIKFCILHPAFYILHFTFCISLAGCTDVLDVAPDGRLSMENIYGDPELVEAMVSSTYNGLPRKGYQYSFYEPLFTAICDDGWDANGEIGGYASTPVYNGTNSASYHSVANAHNGWSVNYWADYYASIRLCNQFLQNTDVMAFRTEAVKKRLIAEVHVLRAYYYFELMKFFGDVPIEEEALPFDHVFSDVQRDSAYKVAKFIAADCDFAINTAELPWRITVGGLVHANGISPTGEAGRVTKALAYAIKTTAMLFAASPLYNDGENHWEEAYQLSKTAVEQLRANGYKLYDRTSSNFNPAIFGNWGGAAFHQYHCQVADYSATPYDEETIYQTVFTDWVGSLLWHVNYVGTQYTGNHKVGTTPTQELVDAFETKDGQPVLNLANPYSDERHLSPNYNAANTLYDPANPYENRDPRLYATVMMNGDTMIYQSK